MFYLIGLGNPGENYKNSRHNTGKMAVGFYKSRDLSTKSPKIIESNEFMNNSGKAVAKVIKNKLSAKKLIVVYDDMDLPIGSIKISYNKSSGGHKGLESIIKSLKTKEFIRIRIGISPTTPSGKVKKPIGEQKVLDFILKDFKTEEEKILKKSFQKTSDIIQTIISYGYERAMNEFN